MKLPRLLKILTVLLGLQSDLFAQEIVRPLKSFIICGNLGIFTARKVDYIAPLGVTGGIGFGYKFSRKFAVLTSGHYGVAMAGSLPATASAPKTPVDIPETHQPIVRSHSDVPFRTVQFSCELRYRFNELQRDASAYLIAGTSYFNIIQQELTIDSASITRIERESTDKSFGFSAGLGVEFPYTKDDVCLFAEIRFSKGTNAILTGNISPYYLTLRAGVNVNL